jgi:hypothetical protein
MDRQVDGRRGLFKREARPNRECHGGIYESSCYATVQHPARLPQVIPHFNADRGHIRFQIHELHSNELCERKPVKRISRESALLFGYNASFTCVIHKGRLVSGFHCLGFRINYQMFPRAADRQSIPSVGPTVCDLTKNIEYLKFYHTGPVERLRLHGQKRLSHHVQSPSMAAALFNWGRRHRTYISIPFASGTGHQMESRPASGCRGRKTRLGWQRTGSG